jgi:hypothetical protein
MAARIFQEIPMRQRGPKITRLADIEDVQVELRKLYRAGRRGEIQTQDMTRLSSVLMQLVATIRDSALEQRMAGLEEQIQKAIDVKRENWRPRAVG